MQRMESYYTELAVTRTDGLGNLVCPICRTVVFELDMEHHYEEGGKRSFDCCTRCREDFERETDFRIDADVLPAELFSPFWTYVNENMEIDALNPKNAVRESDKAKWKSITGAHGDDESCETVRAIWHFPCGCWFEEFEEDGAVKYKVETGRDGWIEDNIAAVVRHLHEEHNETKADPAFAPVCPLLRRTRG